MFNVIRDKALERDLKYKMQELLSNSFPQLTTQLRVKIS